MNQERSETASANDKSKGHAKEKGVQKRNRFKLDREFVANHEIPIILGILGSIFITPITDIGGPEMKTWFIGLGVWCFLGIPIALICRSINLSKQAGAVAASTANDRISAGYSRIFINDGSDRTRGLWRTHRLPEAIHPVPAAFYLHLVNQTNASLMLDSWRIEFKDASGWNAMEWFQPGLSGTQTVLINGPASRPCGVRLSPKYNFKLLSDRINLAPGETVVGWVFLKSDKRMDGHEFRIHVWDTAHREFIATLESGQPMSDEAMTECLILDSGTDDLSKAEIQIP